MKLKTILLFIVIVISFSGRAAEHDDGLTNPGTPIIELLDAESLSEAQVVDNVEVEIEQVPVIAAIQGNPDNPDYKALKAIIDASLKSHKGRGYVADSCEHPTVPGRMTAFNGYFNYEGFLGLETAYKDTGDESFVTEMYTMAELYIDAGRDEDGDGYNDWWSCSRKDFMHHHFEWRAAAGIGVLLNLLVEDSSLSKFNQKFLATFLRDHVWDKWDSENTPDGRHYYRLSDATYMLARMIPVVVALKGYYDDGLGQSTSPGTPGKPYVDFLTGTDSVVNQLQEHLLHPANHDKSTGATNLRGRAEPAPGVDVTGTLSPGTVDISHAQDFVVGMILAGNKGYLSNFTGLINGLCAALNNVIWDGTGFNFYVDGNSNKYWPSPRGWFALVEYCPQHIDAFRDWTIANIQVSSNSHPARISSSAYLLRLSRI